MTEETPAWRRERERGNRLTLGALSWLARHAPDRIVDPLVWAIAFWFAAFPTRIAREGSRTYLAAVLGRPPRFADRFRHFLTFAQVFLDRARLLSGGLSRFAVSSENEEIISTRLSAGRGAILLGAHFGSFEALRAFDRMLPGLSVRYLMFQEHAATSTGLLASLNPEVAARVIPAGDGQSAMLAVREALEAGEFVAYLGDRMPVPSARGEVRVAFLGAPMDIPRAPYLSAILAGVPLILCFAPRTGPRRYEIVFTEIYDGSPVARGGRDALCLALAQRFADALAELCRRHPYNWFNFYDVWRPGGRAGLCRSAPG